MIIVKDAMVLIHLAKLSILEKSCDYFKNVIIPNLVYEEINKYKDYPDANIINSLIKSKRISVKNIKNINLIKKANEFNIQHGEAEALALYWQENADLLATDDDNIRKKKELLNIKLIGTPAIILILYNKKIIDKDKASLSIETLRDIGWFSNALLDSIIMEVNQK